MWLRWNSALAVLLAWGGLALGQGMVPTNCQTCDTDRYITIDEGNGPEKCKIIGCWTGNDGNRYCHVESQSTGEKITIMNPPNVPGAPEYVGNMAAPNMEIQVYRYGNQTVTPEGFPVVPQEIFVNTPRPTPVNRPLPVLPKRPSGKRPTLLPRPPGKMFQMPKQSVNSKTNEPPVVQTPIRQPQNKGNYDPLKITENSKTGTSMANIATKAPTTQTQQPTRKGLFNGKLKKMFGFHDSPKQPVNTQQQVVKKPTPTKTTVVGKIPTTENIPPLLPTPPNTKRTQVTKTTPKFVNPKQTKTVVPTIPDKVGEYPKNDNPLVQLPAIPPVPTPKTVKTDTKQPQTPTNQVFKKVIVRQIPGIVKTDSVLVVPNNSKIGRTLSGAPSTATSGVLANKIGTSKVNVSPYSKARPKTWLAYAKPGKSGLVFLPGKSVPSAPCVCKSGPPKSLTGPYGQNIAMKGISSGTRDGKFIPNNGNTLNPIPDTKGGKFLPFNRNQPNSNSPVPFQSAKAGNGNYRPVPFPGTQGNSESRISPERTGKRFPLFGKREGSDQPRNRLFGFGKDKSDRDYPFFSNNKKSEDIGYAPFRKELKAPGAPGKQKELPLSKTVDGKKADPLSNPLSYGSKESEKKVVSLPRVEDIDKKETKQTKPAQFQVRNPQSDAKLRQVSTNPKQPKQNGLPLGMQSVGASWNGIPYQVKTVPMPMVSVPQPNHPPGPPPPNVPQAPQPNMYVNAFSPPANAQQQQPNPYGYGPTVPRNPYGHPGMMPYGQMAMRPPMPYGYPAARPYQQGPGMPMGRPPYQAPGGRVYSGPMPPNPYGNRISQTAYSQRQPNWQQVPFANPAMDRPGANLFRKSNLSPQDAMYQLMSTLKTSLYPAHREWAAIQLSNLDWRRNPQILQSLLTAAKEDPAAKVRVGCIKALVRMQVNRPLIAGTLESLKADVDPRVREAAQEALGVGRASIGSGANTAAMPTAPKTKY